MNLATLAPYIPYLAGLAEDWLACGAAGFGLWSDDQALACWPAGADLGAHALAAPIRIGGHVAGELRVIGAPAATRGRLAAEAALFGQIVRLDDELGQMTSELIDAQDQILALYDLSKSTRSHLGIAETLRTLADESTRLLRTEGAVMLMSPTLVHSPAPLVDDTALLEYFREVQASGRELVLNSGELPPGIRSACFIPIRVRDTTSAVLGLLNKSDGWFIAPDLKLGRAIAEQAGAQIEHALLYQEMLAQTRLQTEMELARDVQARLLPRQRPGVAGADIYAESRTALHVGGDFYDFVQQPDRPLTLILGDVAGKGVSAALIMGMIHTLLHSNAQFMPSPTPASILGRANEHLYDNFTVLDTFATTFVAQYRRDEQALVYANAGHAPVIFRPAGGQAQLLEADGVPVGVLPISLSEDQYIPFGNGDLLIAATDGFNESFNPAGEMFGYQRLLDLVDQVADLPAQAIGEALYEAVAAFAAGRPRDDDQTLIVLKGVAA